MKRFEFRLERVRQWRQDRVDIELAALERLQNELATLCRERDEAAASEARMRRDALARNPISAVELAQVDDYVPVLRRQLERLDDAIQRATRVNAEQTAKVAAARRDAKLLDILREKQLTEWTRQRDKEQEELAAELYLARLRAGRG